MNGPLIIIHGWGEDPQQDMTDIANIFRMLKDDGA